MIYGALLYYYFGLRTAWSWENAHEGSSNNVDHVRDILNNGVGHSIGRRIPAWGDFFGYGWVVTFVVIIVNDYLRRGIYWGVCGKHVC
jgi:hypothetical protein